MKAATIFAPTATQTLSRLQIKTPLVSVILPTLNEAANVRQQAQALNPLPEAEIIFVDGGSDDGTCYELEALSRELANVHLLQAPAGRARQMNAGAKRANGEWLIFLHVDTRLPPASFGAFLRRIKQASPLTSGAFTFRVAHHHWAYRYLEFYVGLRCKLLRLPFGDQAIFIRKKLFEEIGGYREDFPLMEDMELVQRLNRQNGFAVLDFPVYTSARRYEKDGFFKRGLDNLYLQLLYRFGVHPQELAKKYWK